MFLFFVDIQKSCDGDSFLDRFFATTVEYVGGKHVLRITSGMNLLSGILQSVN